ncbi:MAG: carboxymuconolactone decarboxylase family protein [Hydrocarboniphaga sp.]|uniref:carboxymuconolactone decarboxylase family protein n=1 Tax=Hydrocarboniphaga sp. TaxID=2033016 RepID=UPI00261D0730|nr:carboxymuconolactone decarboxylase family protein [Hydrocarboniphaga sp.]MDB5970056.1 carboxymuconolactone decarboxylase family protein [Hydrocarboniphaga sp.]
MPVIAPYQDGASPEQERIAEVIRARRGGKLINIDRMLLHSLPFAEGYNLLLPKVRGGLALADRYRELLICATAQLTGAAYEVHHHSPVFLKAGGSQAQLDALKTIEQALSSPLFDEKERALLQFALESTRSVAIRPQTMSELQTRFPGAQSIIEIVSVVSVYNMVCRIVVSLGVEIESVESV